MDATKYLILPYLTTEKVRIVRAIKVEIFTKKNKYPCLVLTLSTLASGVSFLLIFPKAVQFLKQKPKAVCLFVCLWICWFQRTESGPLFPFLFRLGKMLLTCK